MSLVNDEEVISLSHAKVHVSPDSVQSLREMNQNTTSGTVWEEQLGWFKDSSQYRTLDTIDGEPMELEWTIFPGSTTLELVRGGPKGHEQNGRTRTVPRTNYLHSYGKLKTMKRNVLLIPHLYLYLHKDFQQDVGHSSDLGQRQSGIPLTNERPQGEWDSVAELMMIKFGESGHPVFRATSPLSRGTLKSK